MGKSDATIARNVLTAHEMCRILTLSPPTGSRDEQTKNGDTMPTNITPRRHHPAHECADHRLYNLRNGLHVVVRSYTATSRFGDFTFHTEQELEQHLTDLEEFVLHGEEQQ